jgi:maltose O-acetyltransferase
MFDHAFRHLIEIHDGVTLAPRVHLLAHDASTKRLLGCSRVARIVIGERAFIGAGATIMPGVHVGADAIVGVGSVVTKDVPPGTVAFGVPASVAMTVEEFVARHEAEMERAPVFDASWTGREGAAPARRAEMRDRIGDGIAYVD